MVTVTPRVCWPFAFVSFSMGECQCVREITRLFHGLHRVFTKSDSRVYLRGPITGPFWILPERYNICPRVHILLFFMCVCICAWESVYVCCVTEYMYAILLNSNDFLYYSQLCRLGPLVSHPAAKNVWCVTLLESPSYPRIHTYALTHRHTHVQPLSESNPLLRAGADGGTGLTQKGKMVQIPKLIKKNRGAGQNWCQPC